MSKNEVFYISKISSSSNYTKIIIFILVIISCLCSIISNDSLKNYNDKSKNKLLTQIKNCLNARNRVRVKNDLTLENIKEIVQAHNDQRNKVAMGQTSKGSSLPQAGNMLQIYWSATIAKGAQEWANKCEMSHSPQGQFTFKGKSLGENIAFRGFTGNNNNSPFSKFVEDWFNEIKDFNGNVGNFQNNGGPAVGHFTQVSWAESYLIGCGYCKKNEGQWTKEYLVCQYYNQGNFIGQPIYQTKNANQCQCSQGYACKNTDYPGLCCPDTLNWCQKNSFLWIE